MKDLPDLGGEISLRNHGASIFYQSLRHGAPLEGMLGAQHKLLPSHRATHRGGLAPGVAMRRRSHALRVGFGRGLHGEGLLLPCDCAAAWKLRERERAV